MAKVSKTNEPTARIVSISSQNSTNDESLWTRAVREYLTDPSLSDEERAFAMLRSSDDFISDLGEATLSKFQKSQLQRAMKRVQPFLKVLERFKDGPGVFVHVELGGVLDCVWGSIRLVLIIAKDINDFIDEFESFIDEISDSVARLTSYESIFSGNQRFGNALALMFSELLQYFRWLRIYVQKNQSIGLRRFLSMHDLRRAAATRYSKIKDLCARAEKEAQLAGIEAVLTNQRNAQNFFDDSRQIHAADESRKVLETQRALLREIRNLLAPIEMTSRLEELQERRMERTCEWLLSIPQITALVNTCPASPSKRFTTIWVRGIPGSGKTFLAGYLTEHLLVTSSVGYFFCSRENQGRKDSASILRTLTWQLLQTRRSAIFELDKLLSSTFEITKTTAKKALMIVLQQTWQQEPRCHLVLDGLDEYEPAARAEILESLVSISEFADLIIVSRHEADIATAMTNISQRASVEQVEVTAEKNALDIASYISARVDQLHLRDSGFASDIIHNLQLKTQGMFLYARLMMEELEIQDTDNERRDTLSIMPTGVDDIYGRALANIDGLMSNRRQRIHQLLQLVLCTARPITLSEAQVALAVKANSRQFDEKNIPNVSNLVDQYCRSFIEIDPKDNTLKVTHATAREFLLGPSAGSLIIKLNVAHNYFLSICLTFLSYERQFVDREPPSSPTPDWSPFRAHVSQNPFLEYAAVHWFSHFLEVINFQQLKNHQVLQDNSILMAGFTRESASALSTFLSSETDIVKWLEVIHPLIGAGLPLAHHAEDLLAEWLEICQGKSMHVSISPEADDFHAKTESSLISPEEKSLTEQISAFISHLGRSNGYGVQRWLRWRNRERHCREPIFIAASFDFHNFVARELDRGVSTEIRSVMDRTPLNLAAWMESHNTMKTLIDRGANVNHSPKVDGITPLLESLSPLTFARAPRDYYAAAHMLLEAGASVDTGLNPLHALIGGWTDTADQYAILEAILAQTKDVNALLEAADSLTAKNCLHLAAAHNEGRLVKHLLQRHSSPSNFVNIAGASGSDGKQPLHEACYFKISKAGPPLVESGAEINGWSVDRWTPLLIAARYKSDILALLLSHGAEVDSQDATGKTALHLTAENSWIDGTERLLKFGCNVDIISNEQETPLDIALRLQNAESIKLLEIAGARRACDCLKIHSWMMANVHVYIH